MAVYLEDAGAYCDGGYVKGAGYDYAGGSVVYVG